ncbi:ABC1 kinase family protein [Paenibacillus dendritiformis]|uniref:ABC1 kinase family protein n=1 Tax=Paenibacillus dendritiformis TaxID=130049 RepID=UPI0020C2551E|nr:AarF/UbiB family protein [Paenibacillus dendritiformis]CAH8773069.1 AarF/UbiB family protein [Paenibacillus dendritiformis]
MDSRIWRRTAVRIRHAGRYRDIAMALMRHGFGYIVEEIGLRRVLSLPRRWITQETLQTKTLGERLRLVLEELGPAFIKLGQLLSTRADLLPGSVIQELEKLQDQVPPFTGAEAGRIIEDELGRPLGQLFLRFDDIPLAAASIGQVHKAWLPNGDAVAVKVQRPGITSIIERDLEILQGLIEAATRRWSWVSEYQIPEMVQEFAKSMIAELDYQHEGRNTDKMAQLLRRDPGIHIPRIDWDRSSAKVLTMEYMDGVMLNHYTERLPDGPERKRIAERLVHAMLHLIFIDGFFHADPHPGNIMVLYQNRIALIDFGMVGQLNGEMKEYLAELIIALMQHRTSGMLRAIARLCLISDRTDLDALRRDLDRLRDRYYDVPFSEVSLGQSLHDLFAVAKKHRIVFPPDLILLAKALLTMEGIVERLDPTLSILDMAEPFGVKLLKEKYSFRRIQKKVVGGTLDLVQAVSDLPMQANRLTSLLSRGKIKAEMELRDLEHVLHKLDQISNRLSFSIVLLAFSIIMVGLIVGSSLSRQPTLLWDIPAIEIGFFIAALMFIWLLLSIFRSGRF